MSETNTARTGIGESAENEVVDLCRDLIRIDTSNYGDHSGPGERAAAEYIAEKLAEVGLEPQIIESHKGRASTVARIEGEDPSKPALLIHGHTDVVPANAADWTHDPFSGEIADGCVWGRGAVDMKDMDAMTLAVVRDRMRSGRKPRATSCWPSSRTRRRAVRTVRATSSTTTVISSTVSPRRSARSAASRSPSTRTCGSTWWRPRRRACTGCGSPWTAPPGTAP